jgi:hypothetical protein
MAKTIHTEGETSFTAGGNRWTFTHPRGYSYRTIIPGGREMAAKVARIISGNFRRNKDTSKAPVLDNLAKANINDTIHGKAPTPKWQMAPSHLFNHVEM